MRKIIQLIGALSALSIIMSASAFAATYSTYICKTTDKTADTKTFEITGAGTEAVTYRDESGTRPLKSETDGDCESRKGFCFNDDTWLIVITQSVADGEAETGHAWLNTDTGDQVTSDNRALLGVRYTCVARTDRK